MEFISSFFQQAQSGNLQAYVGAFTNVHQLFGLLILLFIFLYGISVGKTKALLSLMSIYGAFMLTVTFPFVPALLSMIGDNVNGALVPALLFINFYIIVSALFNFSSLRHRLSMGELSFGKVLVISIFQVGFLASVLFYLLPVEIIPDSLLSVYSYFGTQQALFFWAVLPLISLPVMKSE